MSLAEFWQNYAALIAPLILLQLALIVAALRDLYPWQNVRGPKWLWAIIIVCGELFGPAAYFLVGRQE